MSEWQSIKTAPVEKLVLIYAQGGVNFGRLDSLGVWRGKHNHPKMARPSHWMPVPAAPEKSA